LRSTLSCDGHELSSWFNKSVETNRGPASPLPAARPSGSAPCAPPSLSAQVAQLNRYGAMMRRFATTSSLALIGICVIACTSCMSSKTSNALGEAILTRMLAPQIELTVSTTVFQRENGRWPTNYAELRSFSAAGTGSALTNYDRVDFTQKADGSLGIYSVGPGMTNQMTLRSKNEGQK
jgi:hypothetical protein